MRPARHRPIQTQKQVEVSPNSATYASLDSGIHFGSVSCPYCEAIVSVVGPAKGVGLVWMAPGACEHAEGTASGGGFSITVLFRGTSL